MLGAMRGSLRFLVPVLAMLVAGCDPRPPIERFQVGAIAANLQVRDGLTWGDPRDIQPPALWNGHRWWQVSYGPERIILVDADSGWARLPGPGYVPRHGAVQAPPTLRQATAVNEGSWILVVAPSAVRADQDVSALEREVARLNALAGQTGLHPLFSVRTDQQGRTALVYGWQGDRGIAQDARVDDWLRLRTDHRDVRWVDLLPPSP